MQALTIALLLWLSIVTGEAPNDTGESGYATYYAKGVMEFVVRERFNNDWWPRGDPPADWYLVHGTIATISCDYIGQIVTLIDAGGRARRVFVADCAGKDGPPDRFEKIGVVAELEYDLWMELDEEYGRPVAITIEYEDRGLHNYVK